MTTQTSLKENLEEIINTFIELFEYTIEKQYEFKIYLQTEIEVFLIENLIYYEYVKIKKTKNEYKITIKLIDTDELLTITIKV